MQDAMQPIAEKLKEMKFRKKLFGVDEADVWRQLESLQQEYQKVYDAQAAYYQALLDERDQAVARLMRRRGAEPHEETVQPGPAANPGGHHPAAAPPPGGPERHSGIPGASGPAVRPAGDAVRRGVRHYADAQRRYVAPHFGR